ncbi:MAG: hypothetical protein ACYSVY_17590 [Planctomycetota bacterium]|jgi:hypothetical protein
MRATAFAALLAILVGCVTPAPGIRYFRLRVVDAATGRGIPLVELETVNNILYVTDSAGVAAVHEPGLMGQRVYFHVRSHGYEFKKDGFGNRGFRTVLAPGGSITVQMKRLNVAERLYRVTGQGIYRDSMLLGEADVPVTRPLLNGGVLGQDSVVNAIYNGKLYWFWGDTNRASYPLGNFAVSGAVSDLPANGGLDPAVGVELRYFVDAEGFSRKMCPIEGPGPVWIGGLMVLVHEGREQLVCHYARMKDLGTRHEHGIAVWNDETETFEKVHELPLDVPLHPQGHPVRVAAEDRGTDWFYFPNPYPAVRVRARLDDILEPARYEAFTCLRGGSRWDPKDPPLDRDAEGKLVWAWKADTASVTPRRWDELVDKRLVGPEKGWMNLTDAETRRRIQAHGGSLAWNEHRRKWVMIALQTWGRSMLGEVWYAEADTLLGPWHYACRVVTHDKYSFYNVKQHPYFDQENGRLIYFEGTYTSTFSRNTRKTPRYDYNQVMYRLDLDDPRLVGGR